jgi:hypothetical protein
MELDGVQDTGQSPLPALPDANFIPEGRNYIDLLSPADEAMIYIICANWEEFVREAEGALGAML